MNKIDKLTNPIHPIHPNLYGKVKCPVAATPLDTQVLPFSVISPLKAITELSFSGKLKDKSCDRKTKSCSSISLLKYIGASPRQLKWYEELNKAGKLPDTVGIHNFLDFIQDLKNDKIDTLSKMVSNEIYHLVTLFKKRISPSSMNQNSSSFLKSEKADSGVVKQKRMPNDQISKSHPVVSAILSESHPIVSEILKDILLLVENVIKQNEVKPHQYFDGIDSTLAMNIFILSVLTNDTDHKKTKGDAFNEFLQELNECNCAEAFFTVKIVHTVAISFSKIHIQESKKMDNLFVSKKEVSAYLSTFFRTWTKFNWKGNKTLPVISELFNDVMYGVALLSACFPPSQSLLMPKEMTVMLAVIHLALKKFDGVDSDLNEFFFQMIGKFLGFPISSDDEECQMQSVQSKIDVIDSSFEKLCYRMGFSPDREIILMFLMAIFKTDMKNAIYILKTFIGSGKTASLCLLILLKLLEGQSAVFMTPCPRQVIIFFGGIKSQIEDLMASELFKSLKKDDKFRIFISQLVGRLDKLRVFERHFELGQTLEKDCINIFVLSPTEANHAYVIGHVYDIVLLDDVRFSNKLAKIIATNHSGCAVIVSGADIDEFDPQYFVDQGYTVNVCDIQKPKDVKSMWSDAEIQQSQHFLKMLDNIFGIKRWTEDEILKNREWLTFLGDISIEAMNVLDEFNRMVGVHGRRTQKKYTYAMIRDCLPNIGISIKGDIKVSDEKVRTIDEFERFLKKIAVDPDYALLKFIELYKSASLEDHDSLLDNKEKSAIFHTECESICITSLLCLLRVEVQLTTKQCSSNVHPNFASASSAVSGSESSQCDPKKDDSNVEPEPSADDKDEKKKPKKKSSKKDRKECERMHEEGLYERNSELGSTRPATLNDVLQNSQFVKDGKRSYPKPDEIRKHNVLVEKLSISSDLKKVLKALFENGVGRVSNNFPPEYNEFIAAVFRENRHSYLSTNYPLESMNLGHISTIIIMSSISERDLLQLLGRLDRPNSGDFLQMLEDGRLVLFCFNDQMCEDCVSDSKTYPVCQAFLTLSNMGNKLNVNEVVRPILDVVRRLFGETCDQLFPIQLQELVERIFVALIFRAFHKDMCLSEKNVLPRDFAFVILKCINGDTKAPISSVIKQHFGVSSSDIIKFFDGCCAHLMPMLMSTDTISGFIGGETIEELTAVIEMLSEIFFALETCISILSMTTSSYFENTLSVRNKMNIVSTLLSNTYDHLRILISILDAKRTTISINLKKDESKLGAVVSKRPVNQNMTEFVGFAKCILEDISTKKITVLRAVNHVSRFIDLHTHDKHICTVAKKFIEDLNQLPDVDLLRQSLILRRNVLELLERTVSSGKGTVRLIELFLGLKVTTADKQNVFLGFPSVVKKGTFNHSDELCKMYVMLSSFMVMDGVLGEEQCPAPINNFVSQQSFEALMTALNAFDEKHEHQILRVVKKQDSGSILAEITVQIDELYQRSLNRLLHYSKMI